MGYFRPLTLTLATLGVIGAMASSAHAVLPDLHIVLGQVYPGVAQADATNVVVSWATPSGTVLVSTGLSTILTWTELSNVAALILQLTNTVKGAKKCKTAGDVAGTVLLSGTVDMVFVELTPSLKVAPLYVLPKTKVECEGLNVTIEGDMVGTYNGSLNSAITEFTGGLLGEKGKQALTKYENSEGSSVEAVLLSEAGAGFTKTSINVSEGLTFKVNKMVELLG
jgi:hypothetical protein